MKEREFYSVKLRKKVMVDAEDICVKYFDNKRTGKTPALCVNSDKYGCKMVKFISRESAKEMIEKYGKC